MTSNFETETLSQERRRHIRREMDLDRDELFFLLESYRNMIELNTTLLERQGVLNKGIEHILTEAAKICANQSAISSNIGKLPENFKNLVGALCEATTKRMEEIKEDIASNRKAENDEHHAHTIRIYTAFGIMASIVLALVTLISKMWATI